MNSFNKTEAAVAQAMLPEVFPFHQFIITFRLHLLPIKSMENRSKLNAYSFPKEYAACSSSIVWNRSNRVCLYTICIEIHKQVLDYICHDNRYDVFKDIVYYISLKELEMSLNVFLGSTNCDIRCCWLWSVYLVVLVYFNVSLNISIKMKIAWPLG